MKCPGCGTPNQKYAQRREDFHKTEKAKFKRTDFKMKKCKKCGYEGDV